MACPTSFPSTSEITLWWGVDPGLDLDIPDGSSAPNAYTWNPIPITGESLNAKLSSTISDTITSQRSYAGSVITQGEVGGAINYELQASPIFYNFLVSVLQSSQALDLGADTVAGTSGVAINAVGTAVGDDRTINLTGLTATIGAVYSVKIDNVDFKFTATTTVLNDIATGLAALIDAHSVHAATATGATITISTGAGLLPIEFTSWVPAAWAPGESITNGSTKNCFALMKRVQVSGTTFDYYIFRGCQISSMSLDIKPAAIITGTSNIMGVRPEDPLIAVTKPAHWTFAATPNLPRMSGVSSLEAFEVQSSAGVDVGLTMQDITLTLDNQMRIQQAVGLGHPFAAGIASNRFMASISGTAYYANPLIYNSFINDNEMKIVLTLQDSSGDGFTMLFDSVKVTDGSLPEATGADQDAVVKTEFRAFESVSNGTVKITKLAA